MDRQTTPEKHDTTEVTQEPQELQAADSLLDSMEYKRLRRTWWILLALSAASVLIALIIVLSRRVAGLFGGAGQYVGLAFELLAVLFLIAAWIFDFKKIRPFVKQAQAQSEEQPQPAPADDAPESAVITPAPKETAPEEKKTPTAKKSTPATKAAPTKKADPAKEADAAKEAVPANDPKASK